MINHITCSIFAGLFLLALIPAKSALIENKALLSNIEKSLETQKELGKNRYSALFSSLDKKLDKDEELALKFILAYLPLSDLAEYNGDFFLENARYSLKAKKELSWGAKIPEDIFLHFVLPVRVNNEYLDSFRIKMYDEIKNRVSGMSMEEAALEVNHWCHEKVTYKGSDARTSAPLSTMRYSFGRCGEESTFFVAALRTVGIPSRQVYTPRWAHTDDNHAWVEAWIDGKWRFLGACEPAPALDMGWFAVPSTRTMLVNTRAFGWYNGSEEIINAGDRFSELNLTSTYTPTKKIFVKVIDKSKKPVANALVEFKLYNYAEFFSLAKQSTDKNGMASFTAGMGDLIIWANKDSKFGFKKISVKTTDTINIVISKEFPKSEYTDYDLIPPPEGKPVSVNPKNIQANEARLLKEDSIRAKYMQTFKDSAWAKKFFKALRVRPDTVVQYVTKSYGNWDEICRFLQEAPGSMTLIAINMLARISDKDLRDATADILADHLNRAMAFFPEYREHNNDLWTDYILNPRIGNEILSPWEKMNALKKEIDYKNRDKAPAEILKWIASNITIDSVANLHSRAPLTPLGVYELRVADPTSRDIFFVAVCRVLGLPARLNPATEIPEYWSFSKNTWQNASFEKKAKISEKKGFIKLKNLSSFDAKYYQNFTIELFRDGVFKTMEFEEMSLISTMDKPIEVPAGKYMLVTGNRKSDGGVLAATYFFEVKAGKTAEVPVKVRDIEKKAEVWAELNANDFSLKEVVADKTTKLSEMISDKPFILVFIQPDKEPTKHVMMDIQPVQEQLEKWGGSVIFILEKGKAQDDFTPNIYKYLPKQSIFAWDIDSKLIKYLEGVKKLDLLGDFPIITAGTNSKLNFFTKGYRIGIGDDLLKEIK